MPELKQRDDVESQTTPIKGILPRDYWSDTEPFREKQTRNTPVQRINDSQKRQPVIQGTNIDYDS